MGGTTERSSWNLDGKVIALCRSGQKSGKKKKSLWGRGIFLKDGKATSGEKEEAVNSVPCFSLKLNFKFNCDKI